MNYFSEEELSCPCCGENKFDKKTLEKLNQLRADAGFPIKMNSGYRCPIYNESIGATQTHSTGHAADLGVTHLQAHTVLRLAFKYGFTGIGISQRGKPKDRFIHLDTLSNKPKRPRPHIWSY